MSQLGLNIQRPSFRNNKEVSVGVVESLFSHGLAARVDVNAQSGFSSWFTCASNHIEAVDKVLFGILVKGIPAELIWDLMELGGP